MHGYREVRKNMTEAEDFGAITVNFGDNLFALVDGYKPKATRDRGVKKIFNVTTSDFYRQAR
jgi:hypothetical protein